MPSRYVLNNIFTAYWGSLVFELSSQTEMVKTNRRLVTNVDRGVTQCLKTGENKESCLECLEKQAQHSQTRNTKEILNPSMPRES